MSQSTQTLLAPKTIQKAISQLALPGTTLQNLFGWGLGGTNRARQSGRNFSYDIFDNTRKVATARAPAQAASRQKPQKVGHVAATFPRAAETISLLDEELLNRRRIGGPSDEIDEAGESYITRQDVVEVVGEGAHQLAERRQLLQLGDLSPELVVFLSEFRCFV